MKTADPEKKNSFQISANLQQLSQELKQLILEFHLKIRDARNLATV
jgi:ABC-type Zn uptake system ZnuABC Zn-binding protein ZnuA